TGDLPLKIRELQSGEKTVRRLDGEGAHVHDGQAGNIRGPGSRDLEPCRRFSAADGYGENLRSQPLAVAGVAKLGAHEPFQAVSGEFTFTLLVEPFQIWNHALEGTPDLAQLAGAPKAELDFRLARAAQENPFEVIRQRLVGTFEALL